MANRQPLMPVEDALARILTAFSSLPPETLALPDALGRVLARDVRARLSQPPFDASAMDGYALRAEDIMKVPAELRLIGEVAAGSVSDITIGPGKTARIFTGGTVPKGADTVVMQENVTRLGGDRARVDKGEAQGRHIRKRGLDFQSGDTVLSAGHRLGPRDIGLAAAANALWVEVSRRPRIGLLATGNELVRPGTAPGPSQIVNSNSPALAALIAANGGQAIDLGLATDDETSIRQLAASAKGLDLLITIGGASVGDHDLVQRALGKDGLVVDFWRIAMRPGKPLMFGGFHDVPMIGLPGNPVAAMICGLVFVVPAIRKMLGMKRLLPETEIAILSQDLAGNDLRQDYLRARFEADDQGAVTVVPMALQDSSLLWLFAQADCLIIRPPNAPALAAGATVPVIRTGQGPTVL